MDWDDLRYVLEVARAGGVTAASKALRVSHTTVYRRIQSLERMHGVTLFERGPRGYVPTLVGGALVEVAGEMEERISIIERQLQGTSATVGEVRITTVPPLADRLGELLVAFREAYPDLRVWLSADNEMLSIAKGEADVAIRVTRDPPEQLVGRRVAEVRYAVYASEPFDGATALEEHAWICRAGPGSPQARWEAEHVDPSLVAFRTDARSLFVDLVRRGAGIGVLPRGIGDEDPALHAITDTLEALTMPVWLLTHPDLRDAARVRAVLDFFGEALSGARNRL